MKLQSKTSEKTSFAVLGRMSAGGQKLPLWVLAKRKTQRCKQKFRAHPDVVIRHTHSARAMEDLILASIEWLHREVAKGYPCVLILDVYPSRRTDLVFATAYANNVKLLFVPADGTGRFPLLDHRVFGKLKSRTRAEFSRGLWLAVQTDIDYDASASILIACWNVIPTDNIKKA